MKYLITNYYHGSISRFVEADSEQEALVKLDTFVNEMSAEDFLQEVELDLHGYDCYSEEEDDSIANAEVEL